ncbi:MAG: hypothetical protein ACYSVY_16750 [Planctomycetota bacterium]|jgi:hypothetical protein
MGYGRLGDRVVVGMVASALVSATHAYTTWYGDGDGGPPDPPSSCCYDTGLPGCDDPECEAIVCAVDPFCCESSWDTMCAIEAGEICGNLCGGPSPVCLGDIDGDLIVGITDVLILLGAWGPNPGHPADLNGDGTVGIQDFLGVLANWGSCDAMCYEAALALAAPPGWWDKSWPCGTVRTLYRNTTAGTQRMTFRVAATGVCPGGGITLHCAGSPVGGVFLTDGGETNDVLCELDPGQHLLIQCPGAGVEPCCSVEWTIRVTSTWASTTRSCGMDQDVLANATAANEDVVYEVCNVGDCNWYPMCNGVQVTDPGTGGPMVVAPGQCKMVECTVNAGSVMAGLCSGAPGTCTLDFRRVP